MKVRIVGLGVIVDGEICQFSGEPCKLAILGPGHIGEFVELPKEVIPLN